MSFCSDKDEGCRCLDLLTVSLQHAVLKTCGEFEARIRCQKWLFGELSIASAIAIVYT